MHNTALLWEGSERHRARRLGTAVSLEEIFSAMAAFFVAVPLAFLLAQVAAPRQTPAVGATVAVSELLFLTPPQSRSFRPAFALLAQVRPDNLVTAAEVTRTVGRRNVPHLVLISPNIRQDSAAVVEMLKACSNTIACFLIDYSRNGDRQAQWSVHRDSGGSYAVPSLTLGRDGAAIVDQFREPDWPVYGTYLFDSGDRLIGMWRRGATGVAGDVRLFLSGVEAGRKESPPPVIATMTTTDTPKDPIPTPAPAPSPSPVVSQPPKPAVKASDLESLRVTVVKPGEPATSVALNKSWAFAKAKEENQAVLLVFWATWCGPCVKEIPTLNELTRQFSKSIRFVGLMDDPNTAETQQAMQKLLKDSPFKTHYLLTDGSLGRSIFKKQVLPLPAFALYDRKGQLRLRMIGSIADAANHKKLVEALETAAHVK